MVRGRLRRLNARGFTMTELLVVCAIVGILTAVATPFFMRYVQTASLEAAAQELTAIINGARQLAIARNTNVCVSLTSSQATYKTGTSSTCGGGTTFVGVNTRSDGTMPLGNNMTISGTTASVTFSSLGAAVTAGTYTVRDPTTSSTMSVVVAASGRVRIQ
jgi:type IV fimbrial biogenesis protein FimT